MPMIIGRSLTPFNSRGDCGASADSDAPAATTTRAGRCRMSVLTAPRDRALLMPEGDDRIDPRCPSGWLQTGSQADGSENEDDQRERGRIGAARLDEQDLEKTTDANRPCETEHQAERQGHERPSPEQPQHLPRLRAERHPYADLAGPLRDRIRGDRIETDRRQQQREAGKSDEHRSE